jgi:hypothetical protein
MEKARCMTEHHLGLRHIKHASLSGLPSQLADCPRLVEFHTALEAMKEAVGS